MNRLFCPWGRLQTKTPLLDIVIEEPAQYVARPERPDGCILSARSRRHRRPGRPALLLGCPKTDPSRQVRLERQVRFALGVPFRGAHPMDGVRLTLDSRESS